VEEGRWSKEGRNSKGREEGKREERKAKKGKIGRKERR
jgi:hypothetical protein